jgi:hypothetical protein
MRKPSLRLSAAGPRRNGRRCSANVGTDWNLLELSELSCSKVIELNQDVVVQYASLIRSSSRIVEVCRSHSLTLLLLPAE